MCHEEGGGGGNEKFISSPRFKLRVSSLVCVCVAINFMTSTWLEEKDIEILYHSNAKIKDSMIRKRETFRGGEEKEKGNISQWN